MFLIAATQAWGEVGAQRAPWKSTIAYNAYGPQSYGMARPVEVIAG
jgi:hypothetical protein